MNIFKNVAYVLSSDSAFSFTLTMQNYSTSPKQAKYSCIIVLYSRVGKTGHEKFMS